jgi:precorrin-6B methylase 2
MDKALSELVDSLMALPSEFTPHGSLSRDVLRSIVDHCSPLNIQHSVETGCGKSTVLFSHLSRHHLVFAIDPYNKGALTSTQGSPLLDTNTVEFIEGPTQQTIPRYRFDHQLDAIFIDGPHGYPFPELEYYFTYPFLRAGGLLIVDDIQIPTIRHLFNFLKTDAMFSLLEVVRTTAFFRRTEAPTFDPYGDGWWFQNYNKEDRDRLGALVPESVKALVPRSVKRTIKTAIQSVLNRFE